MTCLFVAAGYHRRQLLPGFRALYDGARDFVAALEGGGVLRGQVTLPAFIHRGGCGCGMVFLELHRVGQGAELRI